MLTEQDLKDRVGIILSDGTPLRDLINVEKREISLRVLNDPEIHDYELRKIFAKAWVLLGHECEIPNPGDYVSRYMGSDNVLVIRNTDGGVSVVLNVCTHRGMELCRVDRGNSLTLQCPYHGWVFDTKGNLRGAPFEKEMYGADWDKSAAGYGLVRAAVETTNGLIFGTFNEQPPTLDEYLGDFKFYLDWNLGDDTDFEVAGPINRFRMPSNWKTLSEQLAGDGYHAAHLHRALVELGVNRPELGLSAGDGEGTKFGYHTNVAFENGHCFLSWDNRFIFSGREPEPTDPFGVERSFPMQVFPCSTIGGGGRTEDGLIRSVSIGGLIPKAPGNHEFWSLTLVNKNLPEEQKTMFSGGFGLGSALGGVIFADDAQQGPSMQRASQGVIARERVTMKYNSTHGGDVRPDNWDGPGHVHYGAPKDDNQWYWWSHWFDVLTAD
jgi:phenylpropionate dioxygenase-like ring-hydroxylating dioxygenase large terminal subunit